VDAIFNSPVNCDRIVTHDRVGREFYQRPTTEVARDLVGKLVVHRSPEGIVAVRVAETEAYLGPSDPAAHTWRGRRTPRVRSMWGVPGQAYVYLVYGLHNCLNLVTAEQGRGEAVLLRGGPVVTGDGLARDRRAGVSARNLANGPGKLCQAVGVTREHDGIDTCDPAAVVYVSDDGLTVTGVETTPRVGVDYAREAAAWPLRFVVSW
jgi:DNA-3-methyladenine glycosylase